ncbi:hypothetical protein DL98DRAFT_232039 [Cadophora sp. DSE1049]|nr:hypothetical protein DL98DRAFT_232039 [Cadophora sp. DSE1049]
MEVALPHAPPSPNNPLAHELQNRRVAFLVLKSKQSAVVEVAPMSGDSRQVRITSPLEANIHSLSASTTNHIMLAPPPQLSTSTLQLHHLRPSLSIAVNSLPTTAPSSSISVLRPPDTSHPATRRSCPCAFDLAISTICGARQTSNGDLSLHHLPFKTERTLQPSCRYHAASFVATTM